MTLPTCVILKNKNSKYCVFHLKITQFTIRGNCKYSHSHTYLNCGASTNPRWFLAFLTEIDGKISCYQNSPEY